MSSNPAPPPTSRTATYTSEQQHHPSSSPSSSSSSCDRRISRAARQILLHDALPILRHHHPKHNRNDKDNTDSTLNPTIIQGSHNPPKSTTALIGHTQTNLDLYSTLLSDLMTTPETCILNPNHDLFWKDERSYDIRSSQSNRRRSDRLHVCWMCGKSFLSRIYLDLHLENHRTGGEPAGVNGASSSTTGEEKEVSEPIINGSNNSINNNNTNNGTTVICPAAEICSSLGGLKRCKLWALRNEPYYARGTVEDPATERFHRRDAVANNGYDNGPATGGGGGGAGGGGCDADEMTVRRLACHRTFGSSCFGGKDDLARDITAVLCDDVWICRGGGGVHSLAYGDHGGNPASPSLTPSSVYRRGIHHEKDVWERHHDEVGSGPVMIVLTVLCLFLVHYYSCLCGDGDGDGDSNGGGGLGWMWKKKTIWKRKKFD